MSTFASLLSSGIPAIILGFHGLPTDFAEDTSIDP
jgi:hypothetical protein